MCFADLSAGHVQSLSGNDIAIASAAPEQLPLQESLPPAAESFYDQPWHGLATDLAQQIDRLLQPIEPPMQVQPEMSDDAGGGGGGGGGGEGDGGSASNLTNLSPRAPDGAGAGAGAGPALAPHPQSAFDQFKRRSATTGSGGGSVSSSKAMSPPQKGSLPPVEEQQSAAVVRESSLTHSNASPSTDHAFSPRPAQQQQTVTVSVSVTQTPTAATASLSPAAPVLRPRPRMGVTAITAAADRRLSNNNPSPGPGASAMQLDTSLEKTRKLRNSSMNEQQILEDTAEGHHRATVCDPLATSNELYDERIDIWQRVQPPNEEAESSTGGGGSLGNGSGNVSAMHRSVSAYSAMCASSAPQVPKPVFNSGPAGFLTPNDDIVLKPGRQFATQLLQANKRYSSVLPRSSVSPYGHEERSERTPPTTKPLSAQPISELHSEPDLAGLSPPPQPQPQHPPAPSVELAPALASASSSADPRSARAQSESQSQSKPPPLVSASEAAEASATTAPPLQSPPNLSAGFYDCAWDSRRDRIEALVATIGELEQPAPNSRQPPNGAAAMHSSPAPALRADSLDSLSGPDAADADTVAVAGAGAGAGVASRPLDSAAPTRSPAATLQGLQRSYVTVDCLFRYLLRIVSCRI